MKHTYLRTSLWHKEKIKDPYQAIAVAFDFSDITFYRKMIKRILISTYTSKFYRKNGHSNLLFEFGMLESIINAAYLINKEKNKSSINVEICDLFNKNLYCSKTGGDNEWKSFPRSLSMKEYINPYLTFKHFFKYQELGKWKQDLQKVFDYAISKHTERIESDLLSIYIHLTKLIEAAHIIDVREITHVNGHIKNRMKND